MRARSRSLTKRPAPAAALTAVTGSLDAPVASARRLSPCPGRRPEPAQVSAAGLGTDHPGESWAIWKGAVMSRPNPPPADERAPAVRAQTLPLQRLVNRVIRGL